MSTSVLSRLSGARVEIHPKPIAKETLDRKLEEVGYPMESQSRSNKAALKEAQALYVKENPNGFKARVEALESGKGTSAFEVVSVVRGQEQNSYPQRFSAREIAGRVFCAHPMVDSSRLQCLYDEMKAMLPVGSVRRTVESLLESYCCAVKATAGIYWVPDHRLGTWRMLRDTLEDVGCLDSYTIQTNLNDPEQLRWISDKIQAEVDDIAKAVQEGLAERNVRDTTLEKRRDQIAAQHERLRLLESTLGISMDACRNTLKQADEALVMKVAASDPVYDTMF